MTDLQPPLNRMTRPDPVDSLRRMSAAELARVGEDSLRDHLHEQAVFAHRKHGPLTPANLSTFLADPDCVRHPTRLIYEFGEMALHQFAQPELDPRDPEGRARVIYLRPVLSQRPELAVLAVAYMLPVANYGEVVTDDQCLSYGATLLGLTQNEFYGRVCAMADFAGSETRERATVAATASPVGEVAPAIGSCGVRNTD